jgi:hypothetical protein
MKKQAHGLSVDEFLTALSHAEPGWKIQYWNGCVGSLPHDLGLQIAKLYDEGEGHPIQRRTDELMIFVNNRGVKCRVPVHEYFFVVASDKWRKQHRANVWKRNKFNNIAAREK